MFHAFKGFLFKEWIKMRYFYAILISINILAVLWISIALFKLFQLDHGEIVWYRLIGLGQIPYQSLLLVPIFSAVTFALWQFIPELRDERLRLSLHLPQNNIFIVFSHFFCGILFLFILFSLDIAIFYTALCYYLPHEYTIYALQMIITWFIIGFNTYLVMGIIIIEPQKYLKIFYAIIFISIFIPLYSFRQFGQISTMLPYYLILIPILFLCSILPIYHYRLRSIQA